MATKKKALQAAAGNAGGGALAIEDVFSTYLYNGTNATQSIVNGIDLAGEGGLVWTKNRDGLATELDHQLMDSEQGAFRYVLESSNTNAAFDYGASIITPQADGFDLSSGSRVNQSGKTYASWTFRKAPRWFDVVQYAGTGSAQNISHNLGTTPGCIIVKQTGGTTNWSVYHRSMDASAPESYYMALNLTNAKIGPGASQWNSTAPTDTQFTVGTGTNTNASGGSYVAYLFAHDPLGPSGDGSDGLIACGSFTAGSSVDTYVTLGWEPQYLLVKASSTTGNWRIIDNMRGVPTGTLGGADDATLSANLTDAESLQGIANFTSTGFAVNFGGGNQTYIYIAIRRGPMRPPESGSEVFDVVQQAGGGFVNTGNVVDMLMETYNLSSYNYMAAIPRLTGRYMETASTAAEAGISYHLFDYNNGVEDNYVGSGSTALYYAFKRAPGFFDVTAYEGDGLSTSTFNHNLGVTPELMIIKNRDDIRDWCVYHKDLGATYLMNLNSTAAAYQSGQYFPADPTETVFRPGNASATNRSGYSHIAYLFASCPGVSKVGSYTGNGSSQTIDCGFTSGARFVLIKNYTTPDSWYVWDSARGIVAGNDPYLRLDTTGAEGTTDDWIDPDASGFALPVNNKTNENGTGYIYLAIA